MKCTRLPSFKGVGRLLKGIPEPLGGWGGLGQRRLSALMLICSHRAAKKELLLWALLPPLEGNPVGTV